LDHVDHVRKRFGADHVAIGTDVLYAPPLPESVSRLMQSLRRQRSFWSHWPADEPYLQPGSCDECETAKAGSLVWTNWPLFTVGLVQRGCSDEEIRKIIGGNVLRVLREVQPPAIAPAHP